MSQHHFATTYQGRPVNVVMGYDRPLRGFFCCVELTDTEDDDYAYCNLSDAKLFPAMGLAASVEYFRGVFAELGLQVPESLFTECICDQANNVGNRFEVHGADGLLAP